VISEKNVLQRRTSKFHGLKESETTMIDGIDGNASQCLNTTARRAAAVMAFSALLRVNGQSPDWNITVTFDQCRCVEKKLSDGLRGG
jgi:hypothetical protein